MCETCGLPMRALSAVACFRYSQTLIAGTSLASVMALVLSIVAMCRTFQRTSCLAVGANAARKIADMLDEESASSSPPAPAAKEPPAPPVQVPSSAATEPAAAAKEPQPPPPLPTPQQTPQLRVQATPSSQRPPLQSVPNAGALLARLQAHVSTPSLPVPPSPAVSIPAPPPQPARTPLPPLPLPPPPQQQQVPLSSFDALTAAHGAPAAASSPAAASPAALTPPILTGNTFTPVAADAAAPTKQQSDAATNLLAGLRAAAAAAKLSRGVSSQSATPHLI